MTLLALLVLSQVQPEAPRLTIDEVRSMAREQLDAVRARIDWLQSQQNTRVATSSILPQLNLTFGASYLVAGQQRSFATVPVTSADGTPGYEQRSVDTPAYTNANFNLVISINQLIYDGGRWWNQIFQAGALEEAAEGKLAEQQLSSELEAERRFYNLLNAQVSMQVLLEGVKRSEEQLDRARALFEAGRGTKGAVFDATTSLANDRIAAVRQRQVIVAARIDLLQWIGRPNSAIEVVPPTVPAVSETIPTLDTLHELARHQRPLLASLRKSIAASEYGERVAFSYFLPSLGGYVRYLRNSPTADPFFTNPNRQNAFQAGGSISWDLFNGLQHHAKYKIALAETERSRAVAVQGVVDVQAEIDKAVETLAVEKEVYGISKEALSAAKEQYALEEDRFSTGSGSALEVRNAQIKFTQAQLNIAAGESNVAIAFAALRRSLGGSIQ